MTEYTCADIMALLEGTVVKDIKELKDDFASLRYELSQMGDRVGTLELTEKKNVKKTDSALKKHQIQSLVNEYNSKEYNIIIYNIPGIGKTEKRLTSYKKVVDTLQNVLQLQDADSINIRNCHRLPGTHGKRLPLIFKVSTMFEKDKIWDHIQNIKTYNDTREDDDKVFIDMVHLPKKLKADKLSLYDDYKTARDDGKRPKWRFDKKSGEYCYVIDKTYFRPKINNFFLIANESDALEWNLTLFLFSNSWTLDFFF